jgi:hypothetical protein
MSAALFVGIRQENELWYKVRISKRKGIPYLWLLAQKMRTVSIVNAFTLPEVGDAKA